LVFTASLLDVQHFKKDNVEIGRQVIGGGDATRPLPRDGVVEEIHGDLTVGPRPKVWTRGQKWKK